MFYHQVLVYYLIISPFLCNLQWLQLIIDNWPKYSENVTTLKDINDICNGVFASDQIHGTFNSCRVIILKVCYICSPCSHLSTLPLILRPPIMSLMLLMFPHAMTKPTCPQMSDTQHMNVICCSGY